MNNVEKYRNLTDLHSRLPVFYQPWWLDATCKEWDIILLEKGENITAVWPFQKERKLFFSLIRTPLLTPYLQPLSLNADKKEQHFVKERDYHELLSLLPSYTFLQFQTLPGQEKSTFLPDKRFSITQRITYYIHLREAEETLFSKINEKRKNDIRKAAKGLIIEDTLLPVALFTDWHEQTFNRKEQQYPYSAALIEKITAAANKNDAALCLVAKDKNGQLHAILWAVYDNDTMYYLLSAAAPHNKHRGAVSLLIWEAICRAKKQGLQVFDFEGSMNPGIEQFFRKFGGEKKTYYSVSHTPSFLWRMKQRYSG